MKYIYNSPVFVKDKSHSSTRSQHIHVGLIYAIGNCINPGEAPMLQIFTDEQYSYEFEPRELMNNNAQLGKPSTMGNSAFNMLTSSAAMSLNKTITNNSCTTMPMIHQKKYIYFYEIHAKVFNFLMNTTTGVEASSNLTEIISSPAQSRDHANWFSANLGLLQR